MTHLNFLNFIGKPTSSKGFNTQAWAKSLWWHTIQQQLGLNYPHQRLLCHTKTHLKSLLEIATLTTRDSSKRQMDSCKVFLTHMRLLPTEEFSLRELNGHISTRSCPEHRGWPKEEQWTDNKSNKRKEREDQCKPAVRAKLSISKCALQLAIYRV